MKRLIFVLCVLNALYATAAQPPHPSRDSGTEENFNVIFNDMISHLHDGNGSSKPHSLVPELDSTYDLGAVGAEWANLYVDTITANGQITATGGLQLQVSTAPRTSVTLGGTNAAGRLVYNSTHGYLCVSTSTNQNSYVIVTTITANVPCGS